MGKALAPRSAAGTECKSEDQQDQSDEEPENPDRKQIRCYGAGRGDARPQCQQRRCERSEEAHSSIIDGLRHGIECLPGVACNEERAYIVASLGEE